MIEVIFKLVNLANFLKITDSLNKDLKNDLSVKRLKITLNLKYVYNKMKTFNFYLFSSNEHIKLLKRNEKRLY